MRSGRGSTATKVSLKETQKRKTTMKIMIHSVNWMLCTVAINLLSYQRLYCTSIFVSKLSKLPYLPTSFLFNFLQNMFEVEMQCDRSVKR